MQISDEVRKCVAFVGYRTKSGFELGGTAFFVGYPVTEDGQALYVVTARHVIDGVRERSSDGKAYLRLNRRDGGVEWHGIVFDHWLPHDDPRVDVAVAPLLGSMLSTFDHRMVPLSVLATKENIADGQIDVGEDLYFPGLFTHRAGDARNLPIVRVGNIAAMPSEDVQTSWGWVRAPYLIEARSIGGLSGSPVFFDFGPVRGVLPGEAPPTLPPAKYLLGLIHGHYDNCGSPWDSPGGSRQDSINSGIAIVVPADHIREVMELPFLLELREAMRHHVTEAGVGNRQDG